MARDPQDPLSAEIDAALDGVDLQNLDSREAAAAPGAASGGAQASAKNAARGPANVARRLMVRHYMSVYRAAAPLDTRNLAYYEAIRMLSALTFTGEDRPQTGNPWNAPHTKARLIRQFRRITGLELR